MLTEAVVISLLGLVPQTTRVLAVELTVLGVAGWVFALVLFVRRPRDVAGPTKGQQVGQFVLGQMATLPVIVAGLALGGCRRRSLLARGRDPLPPRKRDRQRLGAPRRDPPVT